MMRNDLITNNPLRRLEREDGQILPAGGIGVVLSPAGVGKTAFVVQIAIDAMMREKHVLHISLGDSIEKITLWYREIFQNLAGRHAIQQVDDLWQSILPWRFIMTFKIAKFSVPTLEERLTDLFAQEIFRPSLIMIDGLTFEGNDLSHLPEFKDLAVRFGLSLWFTGQSHRDEDRGPDGMPGRLTAAADQFDRMLELKPGESGIPVTALKGFPEETGLCLDPATMLIQASAARK